MFLSTHRLMKTFRRLHLDPEHFDLIFNITHSMLSPTALSHFLTDAKLHLLFDDDIRDAHLIYNNDAQAPDGTAEPRLYEMWPVSDNRIIYVIHSSSTAGRINYPTATY